MNSKLAVRLAIISFAWIYAGGAFAQITATVSSDQASYVFGESVEITVTAVNSGPVPMTLVFPSSLQSQYVLDNTYVNNESGLAVFTSAIVPANGTLNWTYKHNWDYFSLDVGTHEVIGKVVGYATSAPANFSITAPDPVVDDVFIDFESYPNGKPIAGIWRAAYATWGVEFHSDGGDLSLRKDADNTILYTPSGAHPFNIVAEFAMNVFRVSADVGSAANETVTMSVFDFGANLLGTATSGPVANYPGLVGSLSFSSLVPIGSVKWVSSNPLATVLVDNLSLKVVLAPEASTLVLAVTAATALLGITGWRSPQRRRVT